MPELMVSTYSKSRTGPRDYPRRIHTDDMVIGLALGSPREQPLPPTPKDGPDYLHKFSPSPETAYLKPAPLRPLRAERNVKVPKPRAQIWKGIGGFFSRKATSSNDAQPEPMYMLKRPALQEQWKPKPAPQSPEELSAPGLWQEVQWKPEEKVHTRTSAESAQALDGGGLLRRASSRRKGLRKRNVEAVAGGRQRALTAPSRSGNSVSPLPTGPENKQNQFKPPTAPAFLQVEIPNVEMERYSVMFRDLLKSSQSKSPPPPMPQERKGSQDQLDLPPISDRTFSDAPKPKSARKDSGSSTSSKAPSFSLFPPPNPQSNRVVVNKPLPKPSPLSRSVTAPDGAATQPRPVIKASKSQEPSGLMIILHEQDDNHLDDPSQESRKVRDLHSHSRQGSSQKQFTSTTHSHQASSKSLSISSLKDLPSPPAQTSQQPDHHHHHEQRPSTSGQSKPPISAYNQSFPTRSSSLKSSNPRKAHQAPAPPPKRSNASPPPSPPPPLPSLPLPPPLKVRSKAPTSQNHIRKTSATLHPNMAHTTFTNLNSISALGLPNSLAPSGAHDSTSTLSSAAHSSDTGTTEQPQTHVVAIARQVSLSRREKSEKKEVVVPVSAAGATSPLLGQGSIPAARQVRMVDEGDRREGMAARKSEYVFVEEG